VNFVSLCRDLKLLCEQSVIVLLSAIFLALHHLHHQQLKAADMVTLIRYVSLRSMFSAHTFHMSMHVTSSIF
jgi:hypothetical protein